MKTALEQLLEISRTWASGRGFDPSEAARLRRTAIGLNHLHYLENIPVYRKLAREQGCHENADIDDIRQKMMLDAGIFKSYEQSWLDAAEYGKMNNWLSGLFHRRINVPVDGITTIDGWLERLAAAGIHVVYSSGTSGVFSFVPREAIDWETARSANMALLAPLLAERIGGGLLKRMAGVINIQALKRLTGQAGLTGYNAAFLGFRQGRMGNQALMAELSPLFRHCHYLYDIPVTGNTLLAMRRGPRNEKESRLLKDLEQQVVKNNEDNYRACIDFLRESAAGGQKVFIFGAPAQFMELCGYIDRRNKLSLSKYSLALLGGGWKNFTGETVDRDELIAMISKQLGLSPDMILEGYSMTETNILMLRCPHGRFHIPPVIEPVIMDEALNPLEGSDVSGAFGFLDPLAVSYPGFIISGDSVRMVKGDCACGLSGPAILKIGRLPGAEVKGCGGIMGSLTA